METLEKEETKILISIQKDGISQLQQLAESNVFLLNRITQLSGLKDEEAILSVSGQGAKTYVMRLFFQANPEAEKLSKFSKMDFVIGQDLENLQRLLESATVRHFQFVEFDRKAKQWIIDTDDLERAKERYKVYCVGDEEVRRFKLATDYLNFVRGLGYNSQMTFYRNNPMIENHAVEGLRVRPDFIKAVYRY